MSKEITNSVDIAFAMLGQKRPAAAPSITEHQQRKLGMTQAELAAVGRGTLVAHQPQAGLRFGLFDDEPDDAPPIPSDATVVQGLDGESTAAYAEGLAAERRRVGAKPVVEPVLEEKPETNTQRINREHAERMAKIAQLKSDLAAYARRHGIDPHAPIDPAPAKDPALTEARRLSEAKKLVLDAAAAKAKERREQKDRRRLAKRLGI